MKNLPTAVLLQPKQLCSSTSKLLIWGQEDKSTNIQMNRRRHCLSVKYNMFTEEKKSGHTYRHLILLLYLQLLYNSFVMINYICKDEEPETEADKLSDGSETITSLQEFCRHIRGAVQKNYILSGHVRQGLQSSPQRFFPKKTKTYIFLAESVLPHPPPPSLNGHAW